MKNFDPAIEIDDEDCRREVRELAERWILLGRALGGPLPVTPEWALRLAAEVVRSRGEIACEQHARASVEAELAFERRARAVAEGELVDLRTKVAHLERELGDMTALAKGIATADGHKSGGAASARTEAALIEAIEIIERVRLRRALSTAEEKRLRELRRMVPS